MAALPLIFVWSPVLVPDRFEADIVPVTAKLPVEPVNKAICVPFPLPTLKSLK